MSRMEQRPDASPPPPPQAPAEESMSFDEFCRRHSGRQPSGTSTARRAPAADSWVDRVRELLQRPVRPSPRPERRESAGGGRGGRRAQGAVRRRWWSMPTFRRLGERVARLLPRRVRSSKAVRAARRNPGLAVWLVVFAVIGLTVIGPRSGAPHPDRSQARYRAWLQARGEDAVRASTAEIGLRRTVMPTVRAGRDREWVAGTFDPRSFTVAFNSRHRFGDELLLAVAAHESVHALFDQYRLAPEGGPDAMFHLLVEETTAEVLGAHIAGRAWSRAGRRGDRLTALLLDSHRQDCDPSRPGGVVNHYIVHGREGGEEFGFATRDDVLVHFGPLPLVDAVAGICAREQSPLEAARAVSRRFMRPRLDPEDQLIQDEFERRRRAR